MGLPISGGGKLPTQVRWLRDESSISRPSSRVDGRADGWAGGRTGRTDPSKLHSKGVGGWRWWWVVGGGGRVVVVVVVVAVVPDRLARRTRGWDDGMGWDGMGWVKQHPHPASEREPVRHTRSVRQDTVLLELQPSTTPN